MVEQNYQFATQPGAMRCFLSTLRAGANFRGQHASLTRSTLEDISHIAAPTIVIWGRQDRVLPVAHAHVVAGKIPNAKLQLFDRCGHIPQLEHSDEFNALVLDFLAG